jgi:hypothetical protein
MTGYIVVCSHFGFKGVVYRKGKTVELSDEEALFFLDQGTVISKTETRVSSDADGLFVELQKKLSDQEKIIEQQKAAIANFAADIDLKNKLIAELDATTSKRRK